MPAIKYRAQLLFCVLSEFLLSFLPIIGICKTEAYPHEAFSTPLFRQELYLLYEVPHAQDWMRYLR